MAKVIINTGGGGGTGSDECTATRDKVVKGYKAVTSDSGDEAVEGTLEVQSVINFNVAQYSNLTLIGTWALPAKGPWSGIRIMAQQGSFPVYSNDGTLFYEGAGSSATKSLGAGTWYFKAWNYMTTNYGRMYDDGFTYGPTNNAEIKGSQTFTSSGVFTVPAGVRSIQAFVVGGGAGGGSGRKGTSGRKYGAGGGGGYTNTSGYVNVTPGQQIAVSIGAGGQGGNGKEYTDYIGHAGGVTEVANVISAGGGGGAGYAEGVWPLQGGSGGSGGGGSGDYWAGNGGSDGGNGGKGYGNSNNTSGSAPGQGRTTRAFGEVGNTLYSGGGGGASRNDVDCGTGGAGGGGSGVLGGSDAAVNSGGGGGGAKSIDGTGGINGGRGGDGIAIIRWGY